MKTIKDILDKIDYIVGEREGVSLDLGYLRDADYSLDQALKEISELMEEVIGEDEWEDPDIRGCDQTAGDQVVKPWRRNGLRAEQRNRLREVME